VPRLMSAAMKAAIEADILYPVYFVEIENTGTTLRLWTGRPGQTTTWNGHDWLGVGWLLGFSEVEETAEVKATSLTIGMPAVPEMVSLALTNLRRNNQAAIYEGFLTPGWSIGSDADPGGPYVLGDDAPAFEIGEPAGLLIEDPIEVFRGLLDIVDTTVDPEKPTLSLRYSSQMADFERARERRATHEDQQIDHPGDLFYEYTGALADAVIDWGGA
jgi:hypothetical protein